MKTFILLCFLLPILAHHLPEKDKEFLKQVHESCQANRATYANEAILKKLLDNMDNHQVQVHMRCMAEKAGLQKSDGELDLPVIKERIALVTHNPADVDVLVRKCAVKKDTPEKTATQLWACFIVNDVHYYHIIL